MTKGGRNLLILGICSVAVALITTGVSLAVYHYSGDIYLDRSRPGYLPDEEEIKEEIVEEKNYQFSETGSITEKAIDEYLQNLQYESDLVKSYEKPFDAAALSNESLGIPVE